MPEVGLEPTRPCGQRILNPSRLPFRHSGWFIEDYVTTACFASSGLAAAAGGLVAADVRDREKLAGQHLTDRVQAD